MPTVIALVDQVGESSAERWRAVFANGARLGLGTIVLEPTEDSGRNVEIGDDCTAIVVSDVAWSGVVDGVRCFSMEVDEAAEIFAALTTADERPTSEEPAIDRVPRLVGDGAIEGVTESEAPGEPWPEVSEIEESDIAPPITVRVFGPYEIAVNGRVIDKGLRTVARELLAWYLLRPEGASRGAVVEACWPDTAPAAVSNTFWRPVGDLRRLVGAAADPPSKLLDSAGGEVYHLDVAAIDCDLWRFQAALVVAARAENDEDARRALREAVDCYRGEFLDGIDYFWVEPIREDLHRRALDAHLRLAELEEALDNPDGAEVALHAAAEFDRYAEEPYRRLMTLQAERGRLDAVAATWRLLERRLAEIDVDPEPTTVRLHRSLIAERESMGDERLRRTS
jgi:DNA-binding SARP family transcriptional activator